MWGHNANHYATCTHSTPYMIHRFQKCRSQWVWVQGKIQETGRAPLAELWVCIYSHNNKPTEKVLLLGFTFTGFTCLNFLLLICAPRTGKWLSIHRHNVLVKLLKQGLVRTKVKWVSEKLVSEICLSRKRKSKMLIRWVVSNARVCKSSILCVVSSRS